MLNIDETLSINSDYFSQRDYYLRVFLYAIGAITFIDIVRAQVPEVNLLQLIPGFYLVLLFGSLLFLSFTFDFLIRIPSELDNKKELGAKTPIKFKTQILLRFSFFFFFTSLILIINTIIPLSLDSFNFYSGITLENIWSFDEVINLELILLLLLLLLSQFPIVISSFFSNEKAINKFPQVWKTIFFFSIILSGILTPTIDGYTQFGFTFCAIFLYLIIINIIEKRANIKYVGLNTLS